MTDSVDTDALRGLQALSSGILRRNLARGSGVWKMNRDVTEALGAAADEVDRLRVAIGYAPHDSGCQFSFLPEDKPRRCTCWKAEVL